MARKKYKIQPQLHNQQGLFDFFDDPLSDLPVHPSIEEFVVNAAEKAEPAKAESAENYETTIEIDFSANDAIFFMSFGSGSSGNCSFIGNQDGGFLIDAGVDSDKVTHSLSRIGITMDKIHGICLTHDHSDHVRFIYSFVRKNPHLRIFCTPRTLTGILRRHNLSRRIKDYHNPIYKEFPFKIEGARDFEITAFEVSHDGTDNCGFFISNAIGNFAIATDLGTITPRVDYYMKKANYVMIESNYDAEMLRNGRYPAYLKARISADNGHLDNEVTASYIKGIASKRLSHVFLCHLSQDNNRPEIAMSKIMGALSSHDDIVTGKIALPKIIVLPRYDNSALFTLRNINNK